MRFRLHYDGPLKASGRSSEKQSLRRCFNSQLKLLWGTAPLSSHRVVWGWNKQSGINDVREQVGKFTFLQLVTAKLHLHASLDVSLLRPAPPGSLVGHGGDLDNRIKTLLDALRVPKESELSPGDVPKDDEEPFCCLLQDDALVTALSVETDRLLRHGADKSDVLAIVDVRIAASQPTFDTIGIVAT